MIVGIKTVTAGVSAVGFVSLFSGLAYHYGPIFHGSNEILDIIHADEVGAVAGRIVSVPVRAYRETFKATLKLGQCPLVMKEGSIKICSDEFEGQTVHLAKASTTVDVTRVENSEDVTLHIMGGLGLSVGVLGLVSAKVKMNVAVTTETSKKSLHLMSSYEINKGVITLHHPTPKKVQGDSAMFLSEIEMGGNEVLLVTLLFESEAQKTEVEISVTFKIIFISITAKINFVHETFNSSASCRIQFKSSWRPDTDVTLPNLDLCTKEVEKVESMYMAGPTELREMGADDERSHYFYYFSSWKASPYGKKFNLAVINHDIDFLTQQNTELLAVLHQIEDLRMKGLGSDVRDSMSLLNKTVTDLTQRLTAGLENYHNLSPHERQKLREIYGSDKAPQYYQRRLDKIISTK